MKVRCASKFTFHRDSAVSYRGQTLGFVWQWDDGKQKPWSCCNISGISFGDKFPTRETAAERLRKEATCTSATS